MHRFLHDTKVTPPTTDLAWDFGVGEKLLQTIDPFRSWAGCMKRVHPYDIAKVQEKMVEKTETAWVDLSDCGFATLADFGIDGSISGSVHSWPRWSLGSNDLPEFDCLFRQSRIIRQGSSDNTFGSGTVSWAEKKLDLTLGKPQMMTKRQRGTIYPITCCEFWQQLATCDGPPWLPHRSAAVQVQITNPMDTQQPHVCHQVFCFQTIILRVRTSSFSRDYFLTFWWFRHL